MEPRVLKVLKFLKVDSGKAAEGGGIALSGDEGFKCRLRRHTIRPLRQPALRPEPGLPVAAPWWLGPGATGSCTPLAFENTAYRHIAHGQQSADSG